MNNVGNWEGGGVKNWTKMLTNSIKIPPIWERGCQKFRKFSEMFMDGPYGTDYGSPERKKPSLHGRKFTPTPKFLGTAKAYFVCHFAPIFQISLIYAFIGCP